MWKSLYKKKLDSYFCPRPGFEPTNLQNETFESDLRLSYRGHDTSYQMLKLNWVSFKMFLEAILKESATRAHNYLGAKLWLVVVVLYVYYTISSRKCAELEKNEVMSILLKIYFIRKNLEVRKKFFSMLKFFFSSIFFS